MCRRRRNNIDILLRESPVGRREWMGNPAAVFHIPSPSKEKQGQPLCSSLLMTMGGEREVLFYCLVTSPRAAAAAAAAAACSLPTSPLTKKVWCMTGERGKRKPHRKEEGKVSQPARKASKRFLFLSLSLFRDLERRVSPPPPPHTHKCRCPKEARVEGGDSRSFLRPENGRRRRRIRRKGRRGGGGRKEGGKEADARGLIKRPLFSSEVRTFSLVVVLVSREGKGSSSLPLSQTGATFPVLPSF